MIATSQNDMLGALLIDDDPESLQVISSLIEIFCPYATIIGKYTDPAEGKAAILSTKPDVVLLEMPGMTGREFLRQLPSINFKFIFIGASDQYAMKAFKFGAFGYLLKPVDPKKLKEVLDKAAGWLGQKFEERVNLLKKKSHTGYDQQHRITLPTFEGMRYIITAEIVHIKADGNFCDFHFEDRVPMTISKNIGYFEWGLSHSGFMRVHRDHIVNLLHVREYYDHDGNWVVMSDGCRLPVSGD